MMGFDPALLLPVPGMRMRSMRRRCRPRQRLDRAVSLALQVGADSSHR